MKIRNLRVFFNKNTSNYCNYCNSEIAKIYHYLCKFFAQVAKFVKFVELPIFAISRIFCFLGYSFCFCIICSCKQDEELYVGSLAVDHLVDKERKKLRRSFKQGHWKGDIQRMNTTYDVVTCLYRRVKLKPEGRDEEIHVWCKVLGVKEAQETIKRIHEEETNHVGINRMLHRIRVEERLYWESMCFDSF